MTDVESAINMHLEKENARLEAELTSLRYALQLASVDPQVRQVLINLGNYLPQLTNQATNMSYVATNVSMIAQAVKDEGLQTRNKITELVTTTQTQTSIMGRIADALDRIATATEGAEDEAWRRGLK